MEPISILLVDDNATFLRSATRFLAQYPEVRVIGTAHRGEEAVQQAQELLPRVILLDLNMPGLSGLDTIVLLRSAAPQSRIIVLTVFETDGHRQRAVATGANEFVPKSRLTTDLLPIIQRVAQGA